MPKPRYIELLAPARNAEIAIAAIDCGADAVYIGAPRNGARASATNSIDDIARVVMHAHRYGARVYVTVNTIIYDDEISVVEQMIAQLYHIGVDALIVQDLGILRMNIPPIALHASTQCDTRDAAKAQFLEEVGFSQIVLARELTLDEIKEIHSRVKVPLEAFVHGALCVSYSGDCHASWALKGRSANRGECAQICRMPWRLTDANGREIDTRHGEHLLSLRDMNRSDSIEQLLEAGISSFKIEGRLKDIDYVKNVVTFYRRHIDQIIKQHPEKYRRQSFGVTNIDIKPDLAKSFNRGYTDYFLHGNPTSEIASMASPKSIGEPVGRVVSNKGGVIMASLTSQLANGDGLGYFSTDGVFHGFRLNRVDGVRLYPATQINIPPGTVLWRNRNKCWDDDMQRAVPQRTIPITMELRAAGHDIIALDISYQRVNGSVATVTTTVSQEYTEAKTPQEPQRLRVMGKLGDTIYRLETLNDLLGERFIPASTLTQLRRNGIELLNRTIHTTHHFTYHRSENRNAPLPHGNVITYHDNVANELARQFYLDHGASSIEPALETAKGAVAADTRIMTTRYCLRRELGACLKTADGKKLPAGDLYLTNGPVRLRLHFDCAACRMTLHTC